MYSVYDIATKIKQWWLHAECTIQPTTVLLY